MVVVVVVVQAERERETERRVSFHHGKGRGMYNTAGYSSQRLWRPKPKGASRLNHTEVLCAIGITAER